MRKNGEGHGPELSRAEMLKNKEIPSNFYELLDFLDGCRSTIPDAELIIKLSEDNEELISSMTEQIDLLMPVHPPEQEAHVEFWFNGIIRLEQARIGAEKMAQLSKGDSQHLFEQIEAILRESILKSEVAFRESDIDPLSIWRLAQSRPAEERNRAPWVWLKENELNLETMRANKENMDASLKSWMKGLFSDENEAKIADAVRTDENIRAEYRKLLAESIQPVKLEKHPGALNWDSFMVIPLPHLGRGEGLYITATDDGPILRWKNGSTEASGWDVSNISVHIDDVVGDLKVPVSAIEASIDLDAWQAVKVTKTVEHDPDFPEKEAVRIADSVSSLLMDKKWLDGMSGLLSSRKESLREDPAFLKAEALLAHAVESRAALEVMDLRYVNSDISELLRKVDEVYENYREAVSKLDEDWYSALISGVAVDEDSWWGSRAKELGIPGPSLDLEGHALVDTHLARMRKDALEKKK